MKKVLAIVILSLGFAVGAALACGDGTNSANGSSDVVWMQRCVGKGGVLSLKNTGKTNHGVSGTIHYTDGSKGTFSNVSLLPQQWQVVDTSTSDISWIEITKEE